jgi:hypothetical protein
MIQLLAYVAATARERWRLVRDSGDDGYVTETVLVIATVVALAVVVLTIIALKVIAKANSINLG